MSTKTEVPKYTLLVEWSDEDQIFVGRCPELFYGGVHGPERQAVYEELREVVDGVLEGIEKGLPFSTPVFDAPEDE